MGGGVLITSLCTFIYMMISFCSLLPQVHVTQTLCVHSFIHSWKPRAHPSFACTNEINSPRVHSREIPRVQTRLRPSPNVHGTAMRAQSRRAPAPVHQILRACAVEMHFKDLKVSSRLMICKKPRISRARMRAPRSNFLNHCTTALP